MDVFERVGSRCAVFFLLAAGCGTSTSDAGNNDPTLQPTGSGGSDTAGSGGGFGSGGAGESSTGGTSSTTGAAGQAGGRAESGGSPVDSGSGARSDAQVPSDGNRVIAYDGPIGATNVWTNVTPAAVDLSTLGSCGNYGSESIQKDPARPSDLYTFFMCHGLWKSTDFGQTWTGPVNVGKDGTTVGDCAGAVKIPPNEPNDPPTIYLSCIRGAGTGFWRSTNGGVDWTRYQVAPAANNQQFYPPAVDPYDPNHLLMAGHGFDLISQSTDGGQTWTKVQLDPTMVGAGTGGINFIDTGDASTAKKTWLWMSSDVAIGLGTWRTTDGGGSWTKVETNDHPGGVSEIYQPDTRGVVFMPGAYSKLGHGVFRSTDYGVTWSHVGQPIEERVVIGTRKHMYALYGAASGPGATVDPNLEIADQPGTGTWTRQNAPAGMMQGPAQAIEIDVGASSVIVLAGYNAGLWRYVESN